MPTPIKFNTKVRVLRGFYEDCIGIAVGHKWRGETTLIQISIAYVPADTRYAPTVTHETLVWIKQADLTTY